MAYSITPDYSDCYITSEEKQIPLHKIILSARDPALNVADCKDIVLKHDHKYDDIMFAVGCIYTNSVLENDGVTCNKLLALQEFGNDVLMTKAFKLYVPTLEDICAYHHMFQEKYQYIYNIAIAYGLRSLVNSKNDKRNVVFVMPVSILKLVFPNKETLISESIACIREYIMEYINSKVNNCSGCMSIPSSFVYFLSILV